MWVLAWLFNNPVDQIIGFPVYMLIPFATVALTEFISPKLNLLTTWAIALALAVIAYAVVAVVAWRGLHSTMAIGWAFTIFTYAPIVAALVWPARLLRRALSKP